MRRGARSVCNALAIAGAFALAGCARAVGGDDPPPATAADAGIGLLDVTPAVLDLPATPSAASELVSVTGPWRLVGVSHGIRSYEAPLPLRPRALYYERAPDGMELRHGERVWRYGATPYDVDRPGTWRMNADSLTVRLGTKDPNPNDDGTYRLAYPSAREREDALARPAHADPLAWARRSVQVDDVSRDGLLLPAPARIAWEVEVPHRGELRATVGLVPAEQQGKARSDGVDVEVAVDNQPVHAFRLPVNEGFVPLRVDLSRWAGKRVRLAIASRDRDTTRDHLFLAAPAVVVPQERPKRVVLAFIDTLRRDHVGTYGYTRPTTPRLDAWARGAVVFEDARTVAPWTLPSTRSVLTGAQPEAWGSVRTLQETLAARGWATGAFVGNVYLSSNFEMARGWGEHGCLNWPSAEVEVRRTRDFLARNADRDALAMVHFMDMHLPYKEPAAYQRLWAGKAPFDLPPMFNRANVLISAARDPQRLHRYLLDRYDQNLRYIDDQLAPLLEELGNDAVVVLFADHGEEFWDHGDFEHGHSLYDELLRVPLIVKAPGLPARRVQTPASLTDVTPTVLDLLGLPAPAPSDEGAMGVSLVPTARGKDAPARALAFGRPLYGGEAWGSLRDGMKFTTRGGVEQLFDLRTDATEKRNLRFEGADAAPGRADVGAVTGRAVVRALRVTPPERKAGGPWELTLTLPGGIARAWIGEDPTKKSTAELALSEDGTTASITFGLSVGIHREVFLVPRGDDPEAAVRGGTVSLGGIAPVPLAEVRWDGTAEPLARVGRAASPVVVTWATLPVPSVNAPLDATDDELAGALEALGYMEKTP